MRDMKILMVHCAYRERGGEDQVFESECALLETRGVELTRYSRSNTELAAMPARAAMARTLWNGAVHAEIREIVRTRGIDVVHCHNTFPLISPAVYWAAKAEGAAVVQTLHNYRLTCLNGLLFRDGAPCEDCVGKSVAWSGIRHGCYRESRAASAVTAAMLSGHRTAGTWDRTVDRYIALTEFAKQKMIEAGMDEDRLVVKPNFLEFDPDVGDGRGKYALFVGRLTPEKGIETMLEAWREFDLPVPLRIVGDGVLGPAVSDAAGSVPGIEWLGHRPFSEILRLMADAAMLVMPSIWYEGNPRNIIEAFASGTPVVASRLGAMQSMVEPGVNGLLFDPGTAHALAAAVESLAGDPATLLRLRSGARSTFERHYSADSNYRQLMQIYSDAAARPAGA